VTSDVAIDPMDLAAQHLELAVVVRLERLIALEFEHLDLRLQRRLVDADDDMMLVGLDTERLSDRR
jgi:hypothetical protein